MASDWSFLLAAAEAEVSRTINALPADLRREAKRVPISFERRPGKALQDDGIEPDTLGLFFGDPFPDAGLGAMPSPAHIALYLENIWDLAEANESIYRTEVRKTLLHELGHYLGLDEDDLEQRGLE